MARKPVNLQAAGAMMPRDRIWAAIRKGHSDRDWFTALDLHTAVNFDRPRIDERTVETYLDALAAATYLEKVGGTSSPSAPPLYKLVKDCGVHAPRLTRSGEPVTLGQGQQAMWAAMKALKEFDWRDLAMNSYVGNGARVAQTTARTYASVLCRAGYLQRTRGAKPTAPSRYRITGKCQGAKAPMITRVKAVWDPNAGEIVWAQSPREVVDARG